VYPDALYDAAMLSEGYGLPMWVTESGTMDLDNAVPYLVQHVDAIARALRDGADVRGYYWASLTDFYDWNHGMKRKYGLFAVDPLDPAKQRVARPAADVYRRISEANDVPADLLEAHTP
jgi:beta-glucosidase/6-phospho-beta-glucosidase/beta-galactosidase